MYIEFRRVQFRSDAIVKPKLFNKWNGKITQWEDGSCWSLEGKQDEGICLVCPDEYLRELTDEEMIIGELLAETFWKRDKYSEDVDFLRSFLTE